MSGYLSIFQVFEKLFEARYRRRYDARVNQTYRSYSLRELFARSLQQLMAYQVKMLRSRIDDSKIYTTPAERAELTRLGEMIEHDIYEVMLVVQPETYHRWRRPKDATPKRPGRPRTLHATVNLVKQFATENLTWGYERIYGELKTTACEANGERAAGESRRDATAKQGTTLAYESALQPSAIF
jgi:hypothetical protein